MHNFFSIILPKTIDNRLQGSQVPVYVLTVIAIVSFARSCIHLFAPDGGAASIAGMDLSAGAAGIIFGFALWGSSQLLMALVQLLAVARYRALVPLMYIFLMLEVILRQLAGKLHPVSFAHTPPGAVGNWVMLPLAMLMLGITFWSVSKPKTNSI